MDEDLVLIDANPSMTVVNTSSPDFSSPPAPPGVPQTFLIRQQQVDNDYPCPVVPRPASLEPTSSCQCSTPNSKPKTTILPGPPPPTQTTAPMGRGLYGYEQSFNDFQSKPPIRSKTRISPVPSGPNWAIPQFNANPGPLFTSPAQKSTSLGQSLPFPPPPPLPIAQPSKISAPALTAPVSCEHHCNINSLLNIS